MFFDCWLPSDDHIKLLSFGSVCTQACCQDGRLWAKWSSEISYKGVTKRPPGLGKIHRVVGPRLLMEQGLKVPGQWGVGGEVSCVGWFCMVDHVGGGVRGKWFSNTPPTPHPICMLGSLIAGVQSGEGCAAATVLDFSMNFSCQLSEIRLKLLFLTSSEKVRKPANSYDQVVFLNKFRWFQAITVVCAKPLGPSISSSWMA